MGDLQSWPQEPQDRYRIIGHGLESILVAYAARPKAAIPKGVTRDALWATRLHGSPFLPHKALDCNR